MSRDSHNRVVGRNRRIYRMLGGGDFRASDSDGDGDDGGGGDDSGDGRGVDRVSGCFWCSGPARVVNCNDNDCGYGRHGRRLSYRDGLLCVVLAVVRLDAFRFRASGGDNNWFCLHF